MMHAAFLNLYSYSHLAQSSFIWPNQIALEPMAESTVQKLLLAWQKSKTLCALASGGIMARVKDKAGINRADVCQNIEAILPIVEHCGV